MGKKIDRFVLTSVLAAGLFLYFEAAFQNHVLAILLAVVCCAVILKTLAKLSRLICRTAWHQRKLLRMKSGSTLMQIACMDTEDARQIIQNLISGSYSHEAPVSIELLHPSMQIAETDVFRIWREFRGTDRLIICTSGKCSSEVRSFASSLKMPRLAIVDGDILSQLIAEHPEISLPTQIEKKRQLLKLKHLAQLLFNRRNAPRGLLFSFTMLVMYVFSGNGSYLFACLFLLFTALVSFRRVNRPAKLF